MLAVPEMPSVSAGRMMYLKPSAVNGEPSLPDAGSRCHWENQQQHQQQRQQERRHGNTGNGERHQRFIQPPVPVYGGDNADEDTENGRDQHAGNRQLRRVPKTEENFVRYVLICDDGLPKIKVQKALYVIEVLYDKRLVHTHFGTERLYIFLFCIEARHHLYRVARCHVHKAENHDRYADNNEDGGQQPFNNKVKHMIPTLNIALAAPARHIERVCAGAAVAFELRIRRFSAALRGTDHFATRTSCKSKIAALWVNPSTLALTPTCA